MSQLSSFIVNEIIEYHAAIYSACGLILFVLISTMPKPGIPWTKEEMYRWIYDTLQSILPLNRWSHKEQQTNTNVKIVNSTEPTVNTEETAKNVEAKFSDFK